MATPSSLPGAPHVDQTVTSTRPARRFAPEPIETTARTSRSSGDSAVEKPTKKKFSPQPIETTIRSSNKKNETIASEKPAPRKFAPQLVETSNQQRSKKDSTPQRVKPDDVKSYSTTTLAERRKFAPILVDTAKRTRKAGDTEPAHLASDRTDAILDKSHPIRPTRPIFNVPTPPENTPTSGALSPVPALSTAECRRLGVPVPRRQASLASHGHHSYSVPTLEPIESSESEEEPQGTSVSSSESSSSDVSYQTYKHATRMRESIDATSSGYMLELAAKAAERQLRDQALAAFPNDDLHIPVHHYIGRDSEETAASSRSGSRRSGSVNWELKELRRHHKAREAEEAKEQATREARRKWNRRQQKSSGGWRNPYKQLESKLFNRKDSEMESMRRKASPPMLGQDMTFLRCPSPEPARFDVTQGSYVERTSMCYLSESVESSSPSKEGLWATRMKKQSTGVGSMWSQANSRTPSVSGLWGGMCHGKFGGLTPGRGPTGLLTPRVVDEDLLLNPFDINDLTQSPTQQLPPSPPASNCGGMASLDERLELEHSIQAEFNDEFVTQVYNYLSLGYPSIARRYDDELSKIARVPLSDLRHDDEIGTSRGYIRFGEDEHAKEDGIDEEMCARWKALRAYIHEWARQQPRMAERDTRQGGFGVSVRRGSWAW